MLSAVYGALRDVEGLFQSRYDGKNVPQTAVVDLLLTRVCIQEEEEEEQEVNG
jgi:hypothetical protein